MDPGTMVLPLKFDIIVIGSGAGSKLVRPVANLGYTVALIEMGWMGGTCLNHGCIPSKMLIHPAEVLDSIQDSSKFGIVGVDSTEIHIDKKSLVDRVTQEIVEDSNQIGERMSGYKNVTLFRGRGQFVGHKVVQVNGVCITADKIMVAAGCRASIPAISGLEGTPYLTYKEALRDTSQPKSIGVIGGGYIASELGYFYRQTGASVELMIRNRMLNAEDHEIRDIFENAFSKKANLHFGFVPTQVTYENSAFTISSMDGRVIHVESLLIATGVIPNTDHLNVSASGILIDGNGFIQTNEYLETSIAGIWAFGDITGRHLYRHTANYEGDYLFRTLFKEKIRKPISYPPIPHAVFSSPQIAGVGLTEKQAVEQYGSQKIVIGKCDYQDTAMGNAMLTTGLCKVLFHQVSRKLIGAHIVGNEASTLIHMLIAFMKMEARVDDMLDTIFIHPALPELVRDAIRDAFHNF